MNSSKILISGLLGGITLFILGFIIYGFILTEYMATNYNNCANLPDDEFRWWALILSNFIWAMIYAVVFSWAGIKGFMPGMQKGIVLSIIVSLSFALSIYSMTTVYNDMSVIIVETLVSAVMGGIGAGVVGWFLGRGEKASA